MLHLSEMPLVLYISAVNRCCVHGSSHLAANRSMTVIYVTYHGEATTRFDRAYYRQQHLPLVLSSWKQYGLQKLAVFYPEGDGEGTIAICLLTFKDDAAVTAAFSSPEEPQVMADIGNFSAVQPTLSRNAPV